MSELAPAPKRGRYDRSLTRHERQAEQRERLLAATAAVAFAGDELNVANVVARAGVGRNTFYEYFDDFAHALHALSARARSELSALVTRELSAARTPLERVRAIARAWVEHARADPERAALMLKQQLLARVGSASALGDRLAGVLEAETDSHAALPGLADARKIAAVVAVFETLTRAELGRPHDANLAGTLADLALRLLR